jgi:uncharacterized protein involved in exopolysaccharide biosynthesis
VQNDGEHVLLDDHGHTALIFQRLKAHKAFSEFQRKRTRVRLANNIRTIWSERTFLVRISALGLMLGCVVAFLIPARYTATTCLMPPDSQDSPSLAMAAALPASRAGFGEIAGDLLGQKNTSDVFAGILNSRTLQNHIIELFDLRGVYGVSRMADARARLARSVAVAIDRKTQMITIAVTDRSPQRAAAMASAFPAELNRLVSELSTSSARRERLFLEGRLLQVSQDLENAEQAFSHFASESGAIDIKEQSRAMLGVAGTLQGQLISAQSELEGLREIYSDTNVRVRTQKARIAELQEQLRKVGGKGQAAAGPDTPAAELYPSIRKLPLLGVTYADLYRRTKVQETVYEILTQEFELAKVQEAREIPTIKILDPAEIPENKSFPPRRLIAASSTSLAFLSGIVVLLATQRWHEKDPDDLSKAVANEIWVDLKRKRFLNTVDPEPQGTEFPHSLQRKNPILTLLGWRNAERLGSTASDQGDESSQTKNRVPDDRRSRSA